MVLTERRHRERVHERKMPGAMLEFASRLMFRAVSKVQEIYHYWESLFDCLELGHFDEQLVMKCNGLVVWSRAVREMDGDWKMTILTH